MRFWILLAFVLLSFLLASDAQGACGRGKARAAARAVGGKAVKVVRFVGGVFQHRPRLFGR